MKKFSKVFALCCALALTLSACDSATQSSGNKGPGTAKDGNEQKIEAAAMKMYKDTIDGKYKLISTEQLKKDIDEKKDMLIVDTMPAKHYDKKRIPAAVNAELPVKMSEVTPEQKEAFLKALGNDKNKMIVIYCGFVGCARSDVGSKIAVDNGYTNVYRQPGGIIAWLDAGYPIEGSEAK